MAKFKLLTTRRTSAQELLGITNAKRQLSRKTGVGRLKAAAKPGQTLERKVKRAAGYESTLTQAFRNADKSRYLFGIIPLWRKKS